MAPERRQRHRRLRSGDQRKIDGGRRQFQTRGSRSVYFFSCQTQKPLSSSIFPSSISTS